jgi:CrcB protein
VIGLYAGVTGPQGIWFSPPLVRQFVMVGVLGGFTTFSSFSLQTYNLVADGEWLRGGLNAMLSLALCLAAVWLGAGLANVLNQR